MAKICPIYFPKAILASTFPLKESLAQRSGMAILTQIYIGYRYIYRLILSVNQEIP